MQSGLRVFYIIAIGIFFIYSNEVSAFNYDPSIGSFFKQTLEKIENSILTFKIEEAPSVSPSVAIIANCEPPENPGFENGVVDWSFGANTNITTDAAAGTNAAQIGTAEGTIYSTIADVNTNTNYSLSFQAKANSLSTDATVSLRWLDATGTEVGVNTVNIPNTATYTEFTIASTSPSDATELLIFIEKQAGGTLFVDEFCLTEIQDVLSYSSTDVPITISDNQATTITSTITINEPGLTIEDLNLDLNISHTYVGDLDVTLISPAGTSVLVYNNHCGNRQNIIFTVDDEASLLSCPPNDGNNHSVLTSLSEFDGEELNGTWTLQIYDYYAPSDGGTLNSWRLDFITNSVNICNNGVDDDGDGLVDEYDPNCDCGVGSTYSIGSGSAVSVVSQIGVDNSNEAAGNPDGNAAELYDTTDEIVLDLGFILKAGQAYSLTWHKKTSYGPGAPANMLVAESLNPSSDFVNNPVNPSTSNHTSFVKSTLTANVDTRYIKVKILTGSGDDLVLDAISYKDIVQCTQGEICDNTIDDDGDGDIDEEDSDCDCNSCYQPVVQEYHIPFPEDQVFSSLSTIFPGNASNSNCNSSSPSPEEPINSYISVSVFIDNSIIYFDHWEDDFEVQASNPSQPTSQIWGDGNPFNGAPPGISSDILYAGTVIILDNEVEPSTRQTVFDYDGGDRFATSFPISITRSAWAGGSETLFAGALEVYPTSDWGTDYRFPAGENVDASFQYFEYVGAVVMAQVDGTSINIDKDNNGSFEQTLILSKGQSQLIDGGILIGGRVTSSEPVQVNMITGDICDNYESRWLTIPPTANWSNDYISPVYGGTQKYYVYNPNTSAMTVTVETTTNNSFTTLTVPAGGTANFLATEDSGYRVHNNGGANFYAYVLHDAGNASSSENSTWDWGAALLPLNKLSQQIITGWAPGQDPTKSETENGSPVWVTAAYPASSSSTGPITICIDYDGNGQGAFTDSFGRQYDISQTLDVLESYQAFDPDGDQTSMLIYVCNSSSDAVLSAVWGQDNANASVASPGLDVGTGIPGLNPYFAYKTVTLIGDVDNNDEYNVGDTIQYAIGLANFGFVPISGNFSVSDALPNELTYIENSTKIVSIAGTASVADAGVTPFPLDETGIVTYLSLNPGEEAQVQFNGVIAAVPTGNLLINTATTTKDNITYTPEVIIEVDVVDEICENGIDDDLDGLIDCDCLSEGNVITGNVWIDEDENTVNNNETGIEDIQINIYLDQDSDGEIDLDDILVGTTNSDVNGNYAVEVAGGIATSRVAANNDDGEEHRGFFFQGSVTRNRSDLRLGNAGSQSVNPTIVGTRFRNLNIPAGATITNAYLEFTAASSSAGAGSLTILGEDTDDASQIGGGFSSISSRIATDANVTWTDVPSWFSEQVYETPDLSSIVQEIVDRGGWSSGNDMFFAYFGDARRAAYSHEGNNNKAPILVVQYSIYPAHYIVEIDNGSTTAYSAGASLTTPDKTEVSFNAKDEYSCDNNFGLRVVEICGNGADDDFDGDTDCDDTECGVDITAANNGPVCAGAVLQLTGLAETEYLGTTTYSWTGPNGFTSTEQNPTLLNATLLMSGTYTFTATNDNGCSSSSNTVVVIQADCSGICDQVIQVIPTNPTECFLDNGSIFVTEYGASPTFYQNSIDGVNWFESEHTYSNLMVGSYNIFLRDKVTGITCRTVNVDLNVQDETIYTGENVTPASSCFAADGSIQLNGVVGTDRVSWISSTNPTFVLISTLSPTNTITDLTPGTYYVRVVRGNNDYCYRERIVEVPNSGTPCDDELCDGETRINLFPNGDFKTGSATNGAPLEIGATSYGYTPMTCNSPNDGFYSIINTTDCDGNGSGIFDAFIVTEDHTPGDIDGYMMLVNASFNPDIALERTVTGLCEDTEYEFSLWINNVQPQATIKPNLTFLVNGVGLHTTGDITASGWQKVGFTFFTGSNTTSIFSIRNNAPGGYGNDWAIDDVFVGLCQPEIVNDNTVDKCFDAKNETIEFVINDDNKQFIHYQFQESRDNGATWTNIGTPQTGTFVAGTYTAVLPFPAPLTNAYDGRQYSIIIGTTLDNLTNGCELEAENATTLNIIACDEICTNNNDDDGDGLTPPFDPDCQDCLVGSVTYHRWNNIAGNDIEELTTDPDYPNNPDLAETRTSFETAVNYGDEYGVRMVGYLHPVETGNYTFYLSSDDNSELYLSTDNLMSNKQLIANVPEWSAANDLTKFPSQTSVTISLQAGERYFIEGLQKEGGGGDHLQVFWSTPSNSTPTIIDGQYLSPYGCEICADGVDNDGNGLTDCEDPEGAHCFPTISNLNVSPCQEDDLGDIATISLDVNWEYAPAGTDLIVRLGEINRQIIDVSGGATSPQTITFTIPADGSTNNPISLEWLNIPSSCKTDYTYDAPASCSDGSDELGCSILYLCGDDKPEDGDAWDHGAIEYIIENNQSGTLTPAFTKPDGTGLGLYDPMNNAAPLSIDIDNYSLIIVSPTTEGRIATDLIAALKDTRAAVLLQNYLLVDDLGMSSSGATYSFQTNLYIDNSTSVEIYNYNNPTANYSQVMTGADYLPNADAYLWFDAGDQAAGTNGAYFSYEETDILPGVSSEHGKRVFLGYHMNGLYYNSENGGAMPAPMSEWLVPETDFTTEGKDFWDAALLDAAAKCACAFEIESVFVTPCVVNAGTVGATVEIEVSWLSNVTDNINVTANGSTQTINVNSASSPVTLSFDIPADDSVDNLITALQNGTGCEETATYDTPSTCGANAGDCPGPIVNAGANIVVCEGETVNLSATASQGDGNFTYSWDNGLGAGQNHSFTGTATPTANNVTDYTVTAVDGNGCTTTDVVRVTVRSNPEVTFTSTDAHCGQADGTITFTFTDNANRTGIEFSIDNGATYPYSSNDNAGTLTVPNLIAGSYALSVRWGDNSCPVSLGTETINDLAGPTVSAGADENVCGGESVTISATGNGGTGGLDYTWDNNLGSGQSKIVYPTTTTTYSVTATDSFGCTDTDVVSVVVLPYTDPNCSPCVDPSDADADGVCASEDCDDNDPNIPAPVGTICNDGNDFTTNDLIQQDECTCEGEPIPCTTPLAVLLQQPNYNDNGTPSNVSDDTFTFDVTISGSGSGWIANGQTGSYGQTVTFGPYTVDDTGVIFDILDQDNPNCRENVSVNISSCIYSGVCTCCN